MSEYVGLGASDAASRWLGLRRHQAVLAIAGCALATGWLVSARSSPIELIVGGALLVGVTPAFDARTLAELVAGGAHFVLRTHWRTLSVIDVGDDVVVGARVAVEVRGYELSHRGRLDLSGGDVRVAESLATLADGAGTSSTPRHFSVHVHHDAERVATVLALPVDMTAPDGWVVNRELVQRVCDVSDQRAVTLLERLTYLRTSTHLIRVYRVRDFSAVGQSRALLEQLLRSSVRCDVALHVDVVSGSRSQRLSSRAVHNASSDDAATRSYGFRRSATSSRSIDRVAQREQLVASGRSLVRLGVYVLVRAQSLEALHERSERLWRDAHDAGLRLERGWGLQGSWYDAQLPGGPGW